MRAYSYICIDIHPYMYKHTYICVCIGGNDALSLKKEIAGLRSRLEKMEKMSLLSAGKFKYVIPSMYIYEIYALYTYKYVHFYRYLLNLNK
jgi:hypothetical protein